MISEPGQTPEQPRPENVARVVARFLNDPATGLLTQLFAALSVGWLAWRVFFHFAPYLWAQQFVVDMATVTPWARPAFDDLDGAEPVAMLALVVVATALVCGLSVLQRSANNWLRGAVMLLCAVGALLFARQFSLTLPLPRVGASLSKDCFVLAAAVALSVFVGWGQKHGRALSLATALLLVPVAFVPSNLVSANDASAIITPGLRLLGGVSPAHIYMQYDYMPSLIVEAWVWLGGDIAGLFFITAVCFYALLAGLFVMARRWLFHPGLAGPLLVSVALVRIYAVQGEVVGVPQIGPMRLDLWIVPVALALRFGLRHWAVPVALGLMCIFSRSIGMLYVGGYGLAVGADFLALRLAARRNLRGSLRPELLGFLRKLAPGLAIIVGCVAIAAFIFGGVISDAVLMYRKLGIGQTKIADGSFYWWLMPLTVLAGGLAFSKRAELGEKRGGAALLMVALVISSSIYFFGRSHPHNLINVSAPFLTCFFVSFDLVLLQLRRPGVPVLALQILLSSALVGLIAWSYSGRIWAKGAAQLSVLSRTDVTAALVPGYGLPLLYCPEIAEVVKNEKAYFFSGVDTYYYAHCGYVPQGYLQPLNLAALKTPLISEINQQLDGGATLVLPKDDFFRPAFESDIEASLSPSTTTETAHFKFFKRASPAAPPARRRRQRRPAAPKLEDSPQ